MAVTIVDSRNIIHPSTFPYPLLLTVTFQSSDQPTFQRFVHSTVWHPEEWTEQQQPEQLGLKIFVTPEAHMAYCHMLRPPLRTGHFLVPPSIFSNPMHFVAFMTALKVPIRTEVTIIIYS